MFVFTEASESRIEKILAKYPFKKSAMLPLLTLAQEQEGYVTLRVWTSRTLTGVDRITSGVQG